MVLKVPEWQFVFLIVVSLNILGNKKDANRNYFLSRNNNLMVIYLMFLYAPTLNFSVKYFTFEHNIYGGHLGTSWEQKKHENFLCPNLL